MYPLDVTMPQAGCCVAGGLEFGAGSILGSVRCGGTGLPQASGLFVSLPFRRAIARLVPSGREGSMLGETLPPRDVLWEGSMLWACKLSSKKKKKKKKDLS